MLNNNIRLTGRRIEEANMAYDNYVKAIAALEELGFEVVQDLDKVIEAKPITINKGRIIAVTDPKDEEEIDELYREVGRHIGRINQLSAENEELKDEIYEKQNVIDIQQEELEYYHGKEEEYDADVQGMEEDLEKLREENAALNRKIKALEMFNSVEHIELEEPNTMEGGDAVSTPEDKPKRNPLLDKIKRAPEFTLEEAAAQATKEKEEKEAKEEEEREATKAQFPEYTLEYEQITFDESIDSRTKFGVRGTITFDDASYPFEATNNHHMPIVYGCYDEEVIRLTKEIIMLEIDKFNFMNEREHNAANYAHINDAEFPLVVWRVSDDKGNISYHGYSCTKQYNYILTWDKAKFNYVGRKLVKNAHSNKPNLWKKLSNEKLADKFRAVCASIWPEDFTNDDNDPEPTKDKNVTRVTKEQHQHTNESHQTTKEFFHITKEQQQNTNDEEIRVTKEQHQTTNEIIWDTPIDNFGVTNEQHQSTNDDVVDLTADADDLDF